MQLRRPWIACLLLAASAAGAAVVYKWTDANGVIHFSDTAAPGAEKIVTSSSSSNGIGGPSRAVPGASFAQPRTANAATPTLVIESPAHDQVFFNDDVVPVRLHADPPLRPTQTIAWLLNGRPLTDQAPNATSFTLQGLSRGAYVLSASLTDVESGQSQSAGDVTFYFRQPTELAPQHKRP